MYAAHHYSLGVTRYQAPRIHGLLSERGGEVNKTRAPTSVVSDAGPLEYVLRHLAKTLPRLPPSLAERVFASRATTAVALNVGL